MTPAKESGSCYKGRKQDSVMGSDSDKRLKFKKGKQKEFLKNIIQEFGSQRKLAEFIGVSKTTVRDYLTERSNIPKSFFLKITRDFPELKIFEKEVEEEFPWDWGRIKGGKERVSSIKDIDTYLKYVRGFTMNKEQVPKCSAMKVENRLLERLKRDNVDLMAILAICTMTDGHLETRGNSYRVSFSSSDDVFVNFISALFFELSDFIPAVYDPHKKAHNICVSDTKLGKKLLKLSPEYKTYASEKDKQPTVTFLQNTNMSTKIWAMRFAFSADGSISLPKNNKPSLSITCYNKSLCVEWKNFLSGLEIFGNIATKSSAKEGVAGVRIARAESIKNFYDLGGFIDGIKISSKSKRYCGVEKNVLLAKCVDLKMKK